jgi:protein gp37
VTTSIEWTRNEDGSQGSTWNPIRGCSRISPGCGGGGSFSGTANQKGGCYAESIASRFSGPGQPFEGFATMTPNGPRWTGKVSLIPTLLDAPLRKRKPTTWFISMSDLFHESLTNKEIAAVFGIMAAAHWHRFQVLTKRSARLPEWFAWIDKRAEDGLRLFPEDSREWRVRQLFTATLGGLDVDMPRGASPHDGPDPSWPLQNVWLGVSIESPKFKSRIDDLRACPAAIKFLSLEPLLEPLGKLDLTGIDQCIVGAESGHGARPMFDDWVREIRDQCTAQGVAFFYKQRLDGRGHKVSLPLLDGRQWTQMPAHSVEP